MLQSLLYLAASYGRAAVVDLLLKAGADVNEVSYLDTHFSLNRVHHHQCML